MTPQDWRALYPSPDAPMDREATLQAIVMGILRQLDGCVAMDTSGLASGVVSTSQVGVADIILLAGGTAYAIELKSVRGKLSRYQEAFAQRWRDAGGVYLVCTTVAEVMAGIGAD